MAAPPMAGRASKNEKAAADSRSIPVMIPQEIVEPERDIPGIMAMA